MKEYLITFKNHEAIKVKAYNNRAARDEGIRRTRGTLKTDQQAKNLLSCIEIKK